MTFDYFPFFIPLALRQSLASSARASCYCIALRHLPWLESERKAEGEGEEEPTRTGATVTSSPVSLLPRTVRCKRIEIQVHGFVSALLLLLFHGYRPTLFGGRVTIATTAVAAATAACCCCCCYVKSKKAWSHPLMAFQNPPEEPK